MCVQHGVVARVRPGVQSSSFLPSGLSGLSGSPACWQAGGREGQRTARWLRPPMGVWGPRRPLSTQPPGASVGAFPWQWGRSPVPLGLGKVGGGVAGQCLCAPSTRSKQTLPGGDCACQTCSPASSRSSLTENWGCHQASQEASKSESAEETRSVTGEF